MRSNRNLVNKICLSLMLAIAIYLLVVVSQPSQAQGNLNLKSDIISLKSRISRLEQEVSRLRSSNSRAPNPTARVKPKASPPRSNLTIVNPPDVDGQIIGRSDPLYERLATLAIELKEDIQNLDRRLTDIEKTASFP